MHFFKSKIKKLIKKNNWKKITNQVNNYANL